MVRQKDDLSLQVTAEELAQAGKSSAPRRNNAARLFGYDVFISFALGAPPRGTHSYASDLARRLREHDITVFFSEDEAARGAAEILCRSPATLERWRCEGTGPCWIEIEGRVSYDVAVLLEYITKNTRTPSVRAVLEDARGIA